MNAHLKGMTLREQVEVEAMAIGYRREKARQSGINGAGVLGPTAPLFNGRDRIREIAAAIAEERRQEAARRVQSPSDLIRTMQADWPEQAAAVKAYAEAEGLSLGEAWSRIIGTAVETLRNGGGE